MGAGVLLMYKNVHNIFKQNHQHGNYPNVHQVVCDEPTLVPPYKRIHTLSNDRKMLLLDMTTWIILTNAVSRERNQTEKENVL